MQQLLLPQLIHLLQLQLLLKQAGTILLQLRLKPHLPQTPLQKILKPSPEFLLGGEEPPVEQPIQYTDFTMPEGYSLNPEDSKTLQELGQQFKMPQEAVQKLVDLGVQMQQRQAQEQQK